MTEMCASHPDTPGFCSKCEIPRSVDEYIAGLRVPEMRQRVAELTAEIAHVKTVCTDAQLSQGRAWRRVQDAETLNNEYSKMIEALTAELMEMGVKKSAAEAGLAAVRSLKLQSVLHPGEAFDDGYRAALEDMIRAISDAMHR